MVADEDGLTWMFLQPEGEPAPGQPSRTPAGNYAKARTSRLLEVCCAAAVSGWFVRNHPDIRTAIERAIRDQQVAGLDHAPRSELVERITELERRTQDIASEHNEAVTLASRFETELALAASDLAAARAANRRLMRETNTPSRPDSLTRDGLGMSTRLVHG